MEDIREIKETKMPGKKRKRRTGKWILLLLILIAAGIAAVCIWKKKSAEKASASAKSVKTAQAVRMDITSELSSSSALEPKDTYEVTSLVEGTVLEALFEEGDVVEKDQILYRLDASSTDSDLSSAETSLLRAQESRQTALEEYNEAVSLLSGNTYKSTTSGYIKTLYIKEGDKVGNGTKIAEIYDDSVMKLTVPFLSGEADQIHVGDPAVVTLEDSGEQLEGTVTIVSSMEETLSGGRLVKAVTIEVQNPGGLTPLLQATATVGGFLCGEEGNFSAKTEMTISADLSGQKNLEVGALLVSAGARLEKGTPIFAATSKSAGDYIKSFKSALDSAGDTVTNAEKKLENTQDTIDNYTITAPISGTVIKKNAKVGDKITKGSNGSTTMAVIYDLSAMTFSMSVDELDVGKVKVGQEVQITADAVEGQTFTGTVTNVSLESSYSNGVTNYPVTVTMTETGDLLPGMNVDAKVILESSKDAVCVPAGALMRGNRVYVRKTEGNDSETEEGAPEGGTQKAGMSANVPDGFTAVQVETGIINDDYVEILSGISEGDEVYVSESTQTTTNQWQMGGPGGMGGSGGGMGTPPGGMGAPSGGSGNRGSRP